MSDLKAEHLIDLWIKLTFKTALTDDDGKLLNNISGLLLKELNSYE